mmetsp:Transcript_36228/g.77254  ORF Transcript_36228/g.77254 Transcript_36228/m.77254 type:complete len:102 (+) Transcript_36228:707-1012(+)
MTDPRFPMIAEANTSGVRNFSTQGIVACLLADRPSLPSKSCRLFIAQAPKGLGQGAVRFSQAQRPEIEGEEDLAEADPSRGTLAQAGLRPSRSRPFGQQPP